MSELLSDISVSDEYGGGTFLDFLKRRLEEMGVLHLGGALKGSAKTAASKGNQSFIIKRRAEMRERLVQAAIDGTLTYNKSALAGFCDVMAMEIDEEETDL